MNDGRLNDFVTVLKEKLTEAKLDTGLLEQETLSSGVVNFTYNKLQIGRIYFGKRSSKMQCITNDTVEWTENESFETYVSKIGKWIEYLQGILKTFDDF